jgi:HTH-type transcriptional regulator / antitoxin MqsA
MICRLCSGKTAKIVTPIRTNYLGVKLVLSGLERSKCKSCREEFFSPEQATEYSRIAKIEYQRKKTLTGTEVIRIRKKLGMSQAELEQRLGLGPKVIIRWEKDRVRIPGAANALLRILDKKPRLLKFV